MALSVTEIVEMSRLLDDALPLKTADRRRWLEQLGPEHRQLIPALRQALLPQQNTGSGPVRLDTLPKTDAGAGEQPMVASGVKPGERVGPYQLVRPLGAGGMAEVWLAQRADGTFRREVALKLPMLSRLRPDLARRFAREREILARLEHVNIARLYDAGVTPGGLPYLAMEYVPGEPLTDWCDAHRLGLRERVRLFLQVLDAVQYAHGRHVIHQDLKPSNILVTEAGHVRLLDFGVAKLLSAQDERHTQLTQLYGRALTPAYASPELLRGECPNTASDIYSLGVVLYELLAGSRPYRIKSSVSRSLRGDLDAIVLRALSKAPHQRYDSASALADDLQRYLSSRPVQARPHSPLYRAGKFMLRHRAAIATAAALAVLAAVVVALTGATAPARLDAGAARVSDRSIAVLPFLDMSEKKDQEYFADGVAEEILDLLSRVPDLRVPARTSSFYFKGRPSTIADISHVLGVAHVLEGSVRKAGNHLRITAQLVRADTGYQIWSETYDRDSEDDMFLVQAEIASSVVLALRMSLLPGATPKQAADRSLYFFENSLLAVSAISRPWKRAPSSSIALGWR